MNRADVGVRRRRHHRRRSAVAALEPGRRRHPVLGIPKDHVKFVQRKGTMVERFPAVQQDGTWIRATSRIGIGFVNEAGVVRGYDAA